MVYRIIATVCTIWYMANTKLHYGCVILSISPNPYYSTVHPLTATGKYSCVCGYVHHSIYKSIRTVQHMVYRIIAAVCTVWYIVSSLPCAPYGISYHRCRVHRMVYRIIATVCTVWYIVSSLPCAPYGISYHRCRVHRMVYRIIATVCTVWYIVSLLPRAPYGISYHCYRVHRKVYPLSLLCNMYNKISRSDPGPTAYSAWYIASSYGVSISYQFYHRCVQFAS
jgi:hypothetical protein